MSNQFTGADYIPVAAAPIKVRVRGGLRWHLSSGMMWCSSSGSVAGCQASVGSNPI